MPHIAKVTVEVAGETGTIVAEPKEFRTGSRGFHGQAKIKVPDGRRYQAIINIVEIGSKSPSKNAA